MSILGIVLSTVLPSLLLFGFSFYGIVSYKYLKSYTMSHNGLGIYSYDPFTRKVKTIKDGILVKTFLMYRKNPTKIEWIISEMVSKDDVEKLFRDALYKISNKEENILFKFRGDFRRGKNKGNRFLFQVSFDLLEGTTDYIVNIFWKTAQEKKEYISNNTLLKKGDIISDKISPKGFIAFNLSSFVTNPHEQILRVINMVAKKHVNYIINNQTLMVVISENKIEQVNKTIDWIINKLNNKGIKMGMHSLFKGSAHVSVKNIESNRDIIKIIRVLDFLIILSIDKSVDFMSNRDKTFDIEKYKSFSKGQKMFRDSLKVNSILSKNTPIKKWGKKRKVIDFVWPSIPEMNNLMLNRLLANGNNFDDLIDSHAKNIGINNSIIKPSMIDVNKEWLIRNNKKLTNMNVIYSIRIKNQVDYSEIYGVVQEMRKNGFIFSLNISMFLPSTSILISKMKPEFVVISGNVWRDSIISSPALFASLLGLRKLVRERGIKLIYENPPKIVDDVMAEKLGIEYFYNVKR